MRLSRVLIVSLFAVNVPLATGASEKVRLTAISSHSWTDNRLAQAEASCHEYSIASLQKNTDTLSEIAFESPDWWETAIEGVDRFLFSKISVQIKDAQVHGVMLCAFDRANSRAFELAYSFEGEGLPRASDDKLAKLFAELSIKTVHEGQKFLTFERSR